MENGAFCVYCFAMAVGGAFGVETAGEGVLGGWSKMGVVLENDDLVGEERFTDSFEVGV